MIELTKSEIERFLDDPVWRVFRKEISFMNAEVVASILTLSEPMEIYRAQGRSEVLTDLAKWPEMQLEGLE
jgi:hypothetical protein